MRVGALILCYGTTDFLHLVIKQYKWLDRVLVMNYLFKESDPFPDNTPEICRIFGADVISGSGIDQGTLLNMGLDAMKDFDAVFIADADELITKADQLKLIEQIEKGHEIVSCPLVDYAGGMEHEYDKRTHCPVVICKPTARFYEVRNTQGGAYRCMDATVHHLGFLFSDEKNAWKQKKQLKTNGGQFGDLLCRGRHKIEAPREIKEAYESMFSDNSSLD